MSSTSTVSPLPDIFIGKELIKQRIKRYQQKKHPVLSSELSKDGPERHDTKSIWYAKEHVATWLQEMDYYNADGMRVYFGAYGDNEPGRPPGQLCLCMVLTRADGTTSHKDIILEEEPDFADRIEAAANSAKPSANQSPNQSAAHSAAQRSLDLNQIGEQTHPVTFTPKTREYNYGSPCPPACNGTPPSALEAD